MRKFFGDHIRALALLLATALLAAPAFSAAVVEGGGPSVRMAVDPTVLPPVEPPDVAAPEGETTPPAAERETPAAPDVGPAPVEAGSDLPGETPDSAAAPEPKPAPSPAPQSVPTAAPVPAPAEPAPTAKKPTPAGTITAVVLRSDADGFELTVTADGPIGDATYLNLDNPRRLVIDLRRPWTLGAPNVVRAAHGMVRHVVMGEHPDRLRFVVHFRTPPRRAPVPVFSRKGDRLVVRVQTP